MVSIDPWPRPLRALFVLLAAGVTDTLLAWWTIDVQAGRKLEASLCSGLIGLVSMVGMHTVISKDKLLIGTWLAGLCVGTWFAMSI